MAPLEVIGKWQSKVSGCKDEAENLTGVEEGAYPVEGSFLGM